MISKNCKYSYFERRSGLGHTEIDLERLRRVLHEKKIQSINGFHERIVIVVEEEYKSLIYKVSGTNYGLYIKYTPDVVEYLYGINDGLKDIIETRLGQKCTSAEHARIVFMAQVLGSHGNTDA